MAALLSSVPVVEVAALGAADCVLLSVLVVEAEEAEVADWLCEP